VERFNRTYRTEVLDFYLFSSLLEVKEITEGWLKQYNEERPYESLGNIPPAEYLEINSPQNVSTFGWH
jgi:putative transposase